MNRVQEQIIRTQSEFNEFRRAPTKKSLRNFNLKHLSDVFKIRDADVIF